MEANETNTVMFEHVHGGSNVATTSIHLSADALAALDRVAAEEGVSRNRLIVRACEAMLRRRERSWPSSFLAGDSATPEEWNTLQAEADSFIERTRSARRSIGDAPF